MLRHTRRHGGRRRDNRKRRPLQPLPEEPGNRRTLRAQTQRAQQRRSRRRRQINTRNRTQQRRSNERRPSARHHTGPAKETRTRGTGYRSAQTRPRNVCGTPARREKLRVPRNCRPHILKRHFHTQGKPERRRNRRQSRGENNRMARRSKESRGKSNRHTRTHGREQHGNARHSRRVQPALQLSEKRRSRSRQTFGRHNARRGSTPRRFPKRYNLYHRPARCQGL